MSWQPADPHPRRTWRRQPGESLEGPDEASESLWWLAVSPSMWVLHLLFSYATVAIWCAKVAGGEGPLGPVGWALAAYTVVALVVVAATGVAGFGRHRLDDAMPPHDYDSPGDRHRFLGLATVLLSGVSFIAILYVAVAMALVDTCT